MSKKGSNIFLIAAMLIALAILGGAVLYAMKDKSPDPGAANTSSDFLFSGVQIVVPELYQSCAKGDQCIVIDTHCGFCCKYETINARYEAAFNQSFDKNCRRYNGEFCKCFDLSSYPSCVEGKCRLVTWPDEPRGAPAPSPQLREEIPVAMPEPEPEPEPKPQPEMIPEEMPQPALPDTLADDQAPPDMPLDEPLDEPFDDFDSDSLFAPLPESMPPGMDADDSLNKPLPAGKLD